MMNRALFDFLCSLLTKNSGFSCSFSGRIRQRRSKSGRRIESILSNESQTIWWLTTTTIVFGDHRFSFSRENFLAISTRFRLLFNRWHRMKNFLFHWPSIQLMFNKFFSNDKSTNWLRYFTKWFNTEHFLFELSRESLVFTVNITSSTLSTMESVVSSTFSCSIEQINNSTISSNKINKFDWSCEENDLIKSSIRPQSRFQSFE